jgi:AcrR family transcriptional regulator
MANEPGLRERKKRELRRLLSETAVRLFAEQGFDAVKVSDVAAAAGVSEKTVFNHFATKEDLVLEGREELEAELVRAVRERGPGVSVLGAARGHALAVAERLNGLPPGRRAAFRKVIQATPALHARMRTLSLRYEDELGRALAEEAGATAVDPTPRVVASVVGVLTRLAFGVSGWPEGKRRTHEETLAGINAAFDLLEGGLAGYGARGC